VLNLFLEAKLLLLQLLDYRVIRQWPAHFLLKLALQSGMLELQAADMRSVHRRSSFLARPIRLRLGITGAGVIAISTQQAYLAKPVLRHFDGAEHGCAQAPEAFLRRDERGRGERGLLLGVAW
jgi:hypothetical protein